jgi:hypothetical protein
MRDRPNDFHRKVGAALVGRPLSPSEDVHHKNGNKADSRIGNLEVLPHGEHSKRTKVQTANNPITRALRGKVKRY